MILISKEEAEAIRREVPNVHITKTCRQHSGKRVKRYVEETRPVFNVLKKMRKVSFINTIC